MKTLAIICIILLLLPTYLICSILRRHLYRRAYNCDAQSLSKEFKLLLTDYKQSLTHLKLSIHNNRVVFMVKHRFIPTLTAYFRKKISDWNNLSSK